MKLARYGFVLRGVTQFVGPVLIMVVLYGVVIRTIVEARRLRRGMSGQGERSQHQTAVMLIAVTVVFCLCFSVLFSLDLAEYVLEPYFGPALPTITE